MRAFFPFDVIINAMRYMSSTAFSRVYVSAQCVQNIKLLQHTANTRRATRERGRERERRREKERERGEAEREEGKEREREKGKGREMGRGERKRERKRERGGRGKRVLSAKNENNEK